MNYGKVSSANIDPVEKKPLFHFHPGSEVFSLGSIGCTFRCAHCLVPGTYVVTSKGAHRVEEISGIGRDELLTHAGRFMKVNNIFDHHYSGKVCKVKPRHLPEIVCTPEHRFLASALPGSSRLKKIEAQDLKEGHFVAIPKRKEHAGADVLDVRMALSNAVHHSNGERRKIAQATIDIVEESDLLRSTDGQHSIPSTIEMSPGLARLLGLYCARGRVRSCDDRMGAGDVIISLGETDGDLADFVKETCQDLFGADVWISREGTALRVHAFGPLLAMLLKELCGGDHGEKRVPDIMFNSSAEAAGSFLQGYFDGNGCDGQGCLEAITASRPLAMGVCELLLSRDVVPELHQHSSLEPPVCGRTVDRPVTYVIRIPSAFDLIHGRWMDKHRTFYHEDERYFFVPIESVSEQFYEGYVYNFDIEEDHTYTANFAAVCNCQNYTISMASLSEFGTRDMMPDEATRIALDNRCQGIAFTYNEPTIWHEFAYDTCKLAKERGLYTAYVTNGYIQEEPLREISKYLDAMNIDIKGFTQEFYKGVCRAPLQPVLDATMLAHSLGIHIELTYLIIPGKNDSEKEIRDFAAWCSELDPRVPVHFSRFHPDYRMVDTPPTPIGTMEMARRIAGEEGLKFVYLGNVRMPHAEDTYCPRCGTLLIERDGFTVATMGARDGKCPRCGEDLYMMQAEGKAMRTERQSG
ncbi:MAG: AmmeMemoRadiSam system radical SAM enzyme [Methanomassiliicoccaceae archaeon]|jgi:pyruvate formate lyase activating enzyme|nr:AmmeMemoRadiSam system radical SAM enzyme [Methanomassiliicoccaceae archaeon]